MTRGLAIDDEGRFLADGEPVTHARTLEALWGGLEPAPGGGWIVRIGRETAPVTVSETPFVVLGVLEDGEQIRLLVSGGRRETLDPGTLRVGADGVLRATLASGHAARFSRAAHVGLGALLEEDPSAPGGFRLPRGSRSWPVGVG